MDELLVLKKLSYLREHIGRVRDRRPTRLDEFERDLMRQDALALSLMVAIQESLDIALHIAAGEGWGVAATYAESFQLLAQHAVINAAHGTELGRIVTVRNRIAHGYATLDAVRLWREAPAGLDTLDRFAAAVAVWAERRSKKA